MFYFYEGTLYLIAVSGLREKVSLNLEKKQNIKEPAMFQTKVLKIYHLLPQLILSHVISTCSAFIQFSFMLLKLSVTCICQVLPMNLLEDEAFLQEHPAKAVG